MARLSVAPRGRAPVQFVRDVALTGGAQTATALFSMIAGIIVARFLGPEARGTLSVLVALGSMTVLLGSFGIHQSTVYFMGRLESRRDQVVSNSVLFGVSGGVTVAVLLLATGLAFREQLLPGISLTFFLTYVVAVPFRYFNEFGRRIALGARHIPAYNLPDFIEGIGLLAGTSLLLLVFGDVLAPLVALRVFLDLVIALILATYIHRKIKFRFAPSLELLRRQARYGLRNYAGSLLWVFLLQVDLVLCNYFLGVGPTGVYSVAVATGLPISMLGSVVGIVVFQRAVSESSRDRRIANTNRAIRVLLPLVVLATLSLGLVAHWLVPFVYGRDFEDASTALILLLPGLAAFALEVVLMNFVAGEGSPPVIYLAPLAGALTNLGANLVMIPEFGIEGAAVTSSAAYTLVLALVLVFYLKSTGASLRDLVQLRLADLRSLTSRS